MRRLVIWVSLAALVVVGVQALGDLTQNRPDAPPAPGTRSEIVIRVEEGNYRISPVDAAQGLWAVCRGTVTNRLAPPGVVALGDGRFAVTMDPAVGEHSWRRLKGCLEDMTVDQVVAEVVSKRDLPGAERP